MNISMLLEMAADGMPDRRAVGDITYAELLDRARRAASLILSAGVERVGFVDVNSDVVPTLLFASAIAGVPFVPVSYRLADERLHGVLERIAPALVVAQNSVERDLADNHGATVMSARSLMRGLSAATPASQGAIDTDSVAIWLFTSGTTAEPKAALLRHRHLTTYVISTVEFMAAAEHEATLVSVPPYHIAGVTSILSNVYAGRRLVYLPQFDADEWLHVAGTEAVTHAMVVPTMLGRILDSIEEQCASLPALRHLSYGGGRMPVPTVERALDVLPGVAFVNAYGLTETSSTIAVLAPDDHREARASDVPMVRARLGSVGRPLPAIELEIRDPAGHVVSAGLVGEIHVRGEQVAGEYLGRSCLTDDGWFPTNDSGRLDEAGFLFVEGRLDDVIVRGGENMSPGEIEDVLLEHPAVADAGVTGVPDDEWGEAVAAAVVLDATAHVSAADLQAWVRTRLRSSRVPSIIEIRDSLPYNETGKLLRRVLKQELLGFRQARADELHRTARDL